MNRIRVLVLTVCAVLIVSCSLVFAGVVKPATTGGGGTGGDNGGGNGGGGNIQEVINQTVQNTNNVNTADISTGNIGITFHFIPNESISENFTQVAGNLNIFELASLINQVSCENPALASQLTSLAESQFCTDPCCGEFTTANLNVNSVIFNTDTAVTTQVTTTQQVGCQEETFDYGCGCCFTECVPIFASVTQDVTTHTIASDQVVANDTCIGDVGGIERETVGQRTAAVSANCPIPQGTFVVASTSNTTNASSSVQVADSCGAFTFASKTVTTNVATTNTTNTTATVDQVNGNVFVSPIVLDITGSGKLEASNGNYLPHPHKFTRDRVCRYDYMANGFPFIMEWVGPHDGLLVEPKADGSIDPTCLYSLQGGWDSGYEKLGTRDTNNDGKLTGDELKGLSVWTDTNGNGIADPGEVKTVQELGITEINLHHSKFASTFVMNGKTQKMWDWWPTAMEVKKMRVADLNELYPNQPAK